MRKDSPVIPFVAAFLGLLAQYANGQLAYETLESTTEKTKNTREHPELYREIAVFDFDERKQGNFEDTPLHWKRLEGPGLPTPVARSRFDERIGHDAPPSFRLDIQTRNIAYEYQRLDLAVTPRSDYVVVGYIRAKELHHASAFIGAFFVDRFGEMVPGSQRTSRLIKSTGSASEPWQRIEIRLPGEFPTAYAIRLQTWILQDYVWQEQNPNEIDPIQRHDVFATAWFDDIKVYVLPRVQLLFSNPSGLVLPGESEGFILEVNNATSQPLLAELSVRDSSGQVVHRKKLNVLPADGPLGVSSAEQTLSPDDDEYILVTDSHAGAPVVRSPLPKLPPGRYTAQLRLMGNAESLLERRFSFAVLPVLPDRGRRYADLGVDLGRWQQGNIAGLRGLLASLGCGAVKIGVPMAGPLATEEKAAYFRQLSTLLRVMAENRIDSTGVILPPSAGADSEPSRSIRSIITSNDGWRKLLNPVLAHFGAFVPTWQLGIERTELAGAGSWSDVDVERVRTQLRRFMTIPRLAVPRPASSPTVSSTRGDISSIWVPPDLPTRTMPRQLSVFADADRDTLWLELGLAGVGESGESSETDDLARRIVLAKALGPARLYVPPPFELSDSGGKASWQPSDEFIVMRTLFHFLAGKTAVAAMTPADDTLAIVFEGLESNCMVIWCWADTPLEKPVELYLGNAPRGVTIWGETIPLKVQDNRTLLPVGPTPLIVVNLHAQLARLQASYRVAPTDIEAHNTDAGPVMTFRNPYDTPLTGEVVLTPPGDWQVEPASVPFQLEAGETFSQPISLDLPPRQIARTHQLNVTLKLHAPEDAVLAFREPISVGLHGIGLNSSAYWEGDDLVVEQSLRNMTGEPISFNAFCEPPGRARAEGVFLDIEPDELAVQTYVFPDARDLAGVNIPTGIQEINGKRALNQFAEAPR